MRLIWTLFFLLGLIGFSNAVGIIVPPIRSKTQFTSTSSLLHLLNEHRDNSKLILEDYFRNVPCLRDIIEIEEDDLHEDLFVIMKLKFPNIEENHFSSKGIKNQILNMNIIYQSEDSVDIIRNKKDITEGSMRIGFKLPLQIQHHSKWSRRGLKTNAEGKPVKTYELDICFENILLDRSKLLRSVKSDEDEQLVSREIEIEMNQYANFEEFQELFNNYEDQSLKDLEQKEQELKSLDILVQSIFDELQIMEAEESIKRDYNEQIFSNTLKYQVGLMISVVAFNVLLMFQLLRQLRKKLVV